MIRSSWKSGLAAVISTSVVAATSLPNAFDRWRRDLGTPSNGIQEELLIEGIDAEFVAQSAPPLPSPFATIPVARREQSGTRPAQRLRRRGLIPGVVYGGGREGNEVNVSIHSKTLRKLLGQEGTPQMLGASVLVLQWCQQEEELVQEGVMGDSEGKDWVIVRSVQENPRNGEIENISLLRVTQGIPVRAFVPLRVHGGSTAPGVKRGGFVEVVHPTVEVACAPEDIPECFELHVGHMEGKQCIRYSDLQVPHGVRIAATDMRQPIVRIGGRIKK